MLSAKAMIFSYLKQKKYMCFCSVTEVFSTRMACFQLIFSPHLNGKIPQGPYDGRGVFCSRWSCCIIVNKTARVSFFLVLLNKVEQVSHRDKNTC